MIVFQLHADGYRRATEDSGLIVSKKVFRTIIKAGDYMPKFKKNVTTPVNEYDLKYLMKEKLKITIIALEVV
jgi:hypothetical protein